MAHKLTTNVKWIQFNLGKTTKKRLVKTIRISYPNICLYLFPGLFLSIVRETLVMLVKIVDTTFCKTLRAVKATNVICLFLKLCLINGAHLPFPN